MHQLNAETTTSYVAHLMNSVELQYSQPFLRQRRIIPDQRPVSDIVIHSVPFPFPYLPFFPDALNARFRQI